MCIINLRGFRMTTKKRKLVFRNGFKAGFQSPFLVFTRRPVHFSYRKSDTIGSSWKEVGEELIEATKVEGKRIGKNTKHEERKLVVN